MTARKARKEESMKGKENTLGVPLQPGEEISEETIKELTEGKGEEDDQ